MTAPITVLTAAIPERFDRLAECVRSVAAQTTQPEEHRVHVDYVRTGPGRVFVDMFAGLRTDWAMMVGDDDTLDDDHLQVAWDSIQADPDVDVVYSYCRCVGGHGEYFGYNQPFHAELLKERSIVSQTALFRVEAMRDAGGVRDEWGEDWRLWNRMLAAGARFRSIPLITWSYGFYGGNWSRRPRVAKV